MSKPIDKQYLVDNMKTFVSVILDPRYIIQKKVLPQATADLEGVVYQYIGSDTTNYTIGGFYQCQEVTPSTTPKTYAFVEITTKTAIDGVTIQENINKEIYAVDATSLLKGVIKLGNGLSTDTNGATNVVDRVIVASTMPTAAAALDGNVYLYCGTTTTTAPIYQKGYLYKCQESSTTGVYEFVQIGLHADEETIHTAADGELSVDGKYKKIFNGSSTDWGLLSTQQKTEYDFTAFSDEDEADVDTVVDAVTDGDMHAVTSNAVYDTLNGWKGVNKRSPAYKFTRSATKSGCALFADVFGNTFMVSSGDQDRRFSVRQINIVSNNDATKFWRGNGVCYISANTYTLTLIAVFGSLNFEEVSSIISTAPSGTTEFDIATSIPTDTVTSGSTAPITSGGVASNCPLKVASGKITINNTPYIQLESIYTYTVQTPGIYRVTASLQWNNDPPIKIRINNEPSVSINENEKSYVTATSIETYNANSVITIYGQWEGSHANDMFYCIEKLS